MACCQLAILASQGALIAVRFSRLPSVIWSLMLVFAGCDLTGQYEANFQKALATSGQRAKFDNGLNSDYEEIVDDEGKPIGVKLRLPKVFDNNKQKKPVVDEAMMAAIASKMPNMPKLGANMGYRLERALDDDKGQFQPVAVMFQVMPKRGAASDAAREMTAKMRAAMNFTDVELQTPEGQTLKLKRRRMAGAEAVGAKAAAAIGVADIYLVEGPAHDVMITWVAPKGQAEKYQLQQTSEAAMGTIQMEGAADGGDTGGKAPPAG
jgi:hypothetical protein